MVLSVAFASEQQEAQTTFEEEPNVEEGQNAEEEQNVAAARSCFPSEVQPWEAPAFAEMPFEEDQTCAEVHPSAAAPVAVGGIAA